MRSIVEKDLNRHLKIYLWVVAIFIGAAQTWATRHSINADGISYLDVADAYLRGDWQNALNSMWSPLYSLLLAIVLFVFKPNAEWEYPLAHWLNFAIYLFALVSFNFYLQEIMRERENRLIKNDGETLALPDWFFLIVAYFIFIWSTLVLIKIKHLTPDMSVAAIVFLIAGVMLRIRENGKITCFASLGILLGIGYLAKAPMLPMAFVFLVCAWSLIKNSPKRFSKLLIAATCLAFVALPFIIALSIAKNKLTFGESGKINYAWHVNGVERPHWQGSNENEGVPIHPTRKILEQPAIYEFNAPGAATYSVWYDPPYWYEGVSFQFDITKQLRKIGGGAFYHLSLFSFRGVFLALGFFVLWYLSTNKREFFKSSLSFWFLLIPAFAALAMYSLVHVESRYVAPFVAIVIICFVSSVDSVKVKNKSLALLVLIAALAFSIAPATLTMFYSNIYSLATGTDTGDNDWLVAAKAKMAGVKPGDKIASIGRSNLRTAKWARLAKVKIIAEIHEQSQIDLYWQADLAIKETAIQAFKQSGAKFLVTTGAPVSALSEGWQQLPETNVCIRCLSCD